VTQPGIEMVEQIRVLLPQHANPDRAGQQQAYMKSPMPYYGLQAPTLRAVLKAPLASRRFRHRAEWEQAILALWEEATHRELLYAAIALARHRWYRTWCEQPESLAIWEHMTRTGAWWDVGDEIAIHLVGRVLKSNKDDITPVIRRWSTDDHLWIRRASILSQIRFKADTDRELLEACIQPSLDDRDFFSRKAIGWALREFSKTDPDWVRSYVASHEDRLSGLSRREALKWLNRYPEQQSLS